MGEVLRFSKEQKTAINNIAVTPGRLIDLLKAIIAGTISGSAAKTVFERMQRNPASVQQIIEQEGLAQVSDTAELEGWIDQVLAGSPKEVQLYRQGKTKLIGFFVGGIMRLSHGKADPRKVNALLQKKLSE